MIARTGSGLAARVDALRAFNRFYTRRIGVLEERLLQSNFTLAEARVLYEIANNSRLTASDIGRLLSLDLGYLSRILKKFERQGLVSREVAEDDGRQSHLRLTSKGRKSFSPLEAMSRASVAGFLKPLSVQNQSRLLAAAETIQSLVGGSEARDSAAAAIALRTHRPGDIGWIVHRHGEVYAQEYGWDERFEALVAKIAAEFIENFDPKRERCWIAEKEGLRVGSVVLVAKSKTVAKIRLLLVEPDARGFGIGKQLVGRCVEFARASGYRTITLWTQSNLEAARGIYQQMGFRLAGTKRHRDFGVPLTGETWDLHL
jgi:DNA-binding MarR family transcriptional regulator/GNAT superfamily N-acetyltransferase